MMFIRHYYAYHIYHTNSSADQMMCHILIASFVSLHTDMELSQVQLGQLCPGMKERVCVLGLEYAIREVLEAIIQSCGDRVDGIVDELVEMSLKLLVGQVYMETTLQCWHNRCSRPEAC